MGTNDIHRFTDTVYKNLVENFNSGIKQLLLTGKAYHKSLQGVSSTARAYNDALAKLGNEARRCRGGTEEIGEALLSIADAQRDLQTKYEESTKAVFTELVLPLEHKMENEFKRVSAGQRKYHQGHKALTAPYTKAFESLKKFRKKTRNKYVYDSEKELQHIKSLEKCQERLDDYRVAGLQSALLEERKCHCFLLNRVCAISSLNVNMHRMGVDLYSPLGDWRQLCANPTSLPESARQLLSIPPAEQDFGSVNGGPSFINSNGVLHRDTQSLGGEGFRRSASIHDVSRQSGKFDGTRTLPSRPTNLPPAPPTDRLQVRAIYNHHGTGETQLGFDQGDIINLMGEKSDGWQYGQNLRTEGVGWFPLSFTQVEGPAYGRDSPELHRVFSMNQRVKSLGDLLDSRSLGENMFIEQEIPGNVRRPKSLYSGQYSERPQHANHAREEHSIHSSQKYSRRQSYHEMEGRTHSPPLPPPPPPLHYTQHALPTSSLSRQNTYQHNTVVTQSHGLRAIPATSSAAAAPPPPPPPGPPPPPPPPPTMAPPAPQPNPVSVSLLSQSPGPHGNPAYASPSRHHSQLPAPPPPPPMMTGTRGQPDQPPEDYNGLQESSLYRRMET